MPIRKDKDVKPKSGIAGAFESDERRVAEPPVAPKPKEKKTAIMQLSTYPSWRHHFNVEAAKRGEKIAPQMIRALIDRYGLPDGESYDAEE